MSYFKAGLTKEELIKEYKALAKKYHPDLNPGDSSAEETMKAINAEYDEYFVRIQKNAIGVDWDDLMHQYKYAESSREAILLFLRYDKMDNGGWFTTRRGTWGYPEKLKSNDDMSWARFRGGFKLVEEGHYDGEHDCFRLSPVPARIECPTIQDMYFAMKGQSNNAQWGSIQDPNAPSTQPAYVSEMGVYDHIRTKRFGEMWISRHNEKVAFMKVNGLVMSTFIPKYVLNESETIGSFSGTDLGYMQYQGITCQEFCRTHDVNYAPMYSDVVGSCLMKGQDFYWIDDPVVSYFARRGVLKFYEAGTNFRKRWGTFDKVVLERHLHEMTVEDAEQIQDFLDDLNEEFEEYIKSLIKRGKIRVNI